MCTQGLANTSERAVKPGAWRASPSLDPLTRGLELRYRAEIRGKGDTGWVREGMFIGTRGQNRPIEGFRIELSGETMSQYDIFYMAHVSGKGDTEWLANGDYCGTRGQERQVEGLAIRIEPRKPDNVMLISKAMSGGGKPLAITAYALPRITTVRVSEPDGSDLQVWDRRPVRGGTGYVLINRARPDMCIARGPGQEVVLKDVSEIDTNDHCVWLDDTVQGQWNAIRSKTDLELRLTLHGFPPYGVQGNPLMVRPWQPGAESELMVFPWQRRAENELWQQKKITYDLIGGTDAVVLDEMLQAIYRGCYPDIFKGVLRVESHDIKTVGFDVATAPTVCLPSSDLPTDPLNPSSPTAFVVSIDGIELSVEGPGGAWTAKASVEMLARFTFSAQGQRPFHRVGLEIDGVGLEIWQGSILLEQHPRVVVRLNELLVPRLIEHFNRQIFSHLAIPMVEPHGIKFTAPAVAAQHPHLTAAFCKAPDTAISPRPTPWPAGKAFMGLGAVALNAALDDTLSKIRVDGDWDKASLSDLLLRSGCKVFYRNPQVTILPSSGDKCSVRIDLHGDCYFIIGRDFVQNVPGTGYVSFTSRLVVSDDKVIAVVLESLEQIVLDWRTDKPPKVDKVYPEVFRAFSKKTSMLVVDDLRGKSFPICTFSTLEATIAGRAFEITLRDLEVSSFADAEHRGLALVTGTPTIRIK